MMKSDKKKFAELVEFTDVLICDEAHQFKSAVVSKTVEAFVNTEFRMGTTGTLDGVNINELTLTGLLGQPFKVVTAKEMMDAGQVTKLEIKVIVLKHPDMYCKALKGMGYTEEVNQIVSNPARNSFISNLAIACKGNTLILQDFVERHGIILEEMIRQRVKEGRNVYYIHGAVDVDERERIRKIVETESDAIILATSRLFSTGVNIPSLANIIFASPGASTIQVRQSIGRGLRLKEGKFVCKVFDIADDMRWKSWKNAKFRHMESRIAIYIKEQFEYKIIQSNLTY
jgi:superfamily II DNA or RNA helicase